MPPSTPRRQAGQRRRAPSVAYRYVPHDPWPGITAQPRDLLQAIPHLQLREAMEAGVCCGGAGIYNLVQPDEAAALGRIKANDLQSTAPA